MAVCVRAHASASTYASRFSVPTTTTLPKIVTYWPYAPYIIVSHYGFNINFIRLHREWHSLRTHLCVIRDGERDTECVLYFCVVVFFSTTCLWACALRLFSRAVLCACLCLGPFEFSAIFAVRLLCLSVFFSVNYQMQFPLYNVTTESNASRKSSAQRKWNENSWIPRHSLSLSRPLCALCPLVYFVVFYSSIIIIFI